MTLKNSTCTEADRVVDAWGGLVPRTGGATERERASDLRELAHQLIQRKGIAYAAEIYVALRGHRYWVFLSDLDVRTWTKNRALAKRAVRAQRDLDGALAAVLAIHRVAADRKWGHIGASRWLDQSNARHARTLYDHARKALALDPILTFLVSGPFPSRSKGNPQIKQNASIRKDLRSRGLLVREINALLPALGFKDKR